MNKLFQNPSLTNSVFTNHGNYFYRIFFIQKCILCLSKLNSFLNVHMQKCITQRFIDQKVHNVSLKAKLFTGCSILRTNCVCTNWYIHMLTYRFIIWTYTFQLFNITISTILYLEHDFMDSLFHCAIAIYLICSLTISC